MTGFEHMQSLASLTSSQMSCQSDTLIFYPIQILTGFEIVQSLASLTSSQMSCQSVYFCKRCMNKLNGQLSC